MAEQILNRLRFDRDGRERIVRLVRFHDMPLTADRRLVKRLLSKHGEEAARSSLSFTGRIHGGSRLSASRGLPSLTRWTP